MTPWTVHTSKSDAGTMEVRGAYLVADKLPIEDANLIAAAPDLLSSLEELLDYSGGADNALEDRYVMERAMAAIAKARGK